MKMTKMILVASALTIVTALNPTVALPLSHEITVSIFPPDKSLRATDVIRLAPEEIEDGEVRFLINKDLTVESIRADIGVERWYTEEDVDPGVFKADADSEDLELLGRSKGIFIVFPEGTCADGPVSVEIEYAGVLYDSIQAPAEAYAKGFGTTTGLIEDRGVFLTNESLWYPFQFDKMFRFVIRADVPYDWMPVSQGDLRDEWIATVDSEDRVFTVWSEPNPTPEIYLVAGKYYRHEEYHDGVWVMTYTFEQSDSLSRVYLDATKRYIDMYEGLIGDYPFGKFALVENFWQTGYGMPSFTLLGSKVIRLPFIVHTSYGHEILHNWWGNSVYVDYATGNWCEGLTTYGADYLYKEQMSAEEARDYRHHTLIAFNNYVSDAEDFPLSDFHERHDAASQSVGYGKSLMVYHMLRKSLGDSLFWESLRQFYEKSKFTIASWSDLAATFGEVSGQDLAWFFDQWTSRTGFPAVRLTDPGYSEEDGDYSVSFTLEQDAPIFVIDLSVVIETLDGTENALVRVSGSDSTYTVETSALPMSIAIDPDYDTFRRLYTEEIPITLGAMFGQDEVIAVIGSEEADTTKSVYRAVAAAWGLADLTYDETGFDASRLAKEHVWLLGRGTLLTGVLGSDHVDITVDGETAMIAGSELPLAGGTLISAFRNPQDESLTVGIVISQDVETLQSLAPRIPHYSKYSYLGFTGGRPTLRGVWKAMASPLRAELKKR
ncbi:MAG: M1 family aminopeptidase [Candidatus Eisenbacteria bacterium]